jgi:uncharacterized protein YdhG (YjbR/CyaY superfamily)
VADRYETVDEYIGAQPPQVRTVLREVRRSALAAAPAAEDAISYQIPALALDGRTLVQYAAWKHHVSVYPVPKDDPDLREELAAYTKGKGTLQFPLSEPVPYDLIERVVAQLLSQRA